MRSESARESCRQTKKSLRGATGIFANFHSQKKKSAKAAMPESRHPKTGPETQGNDVPPQFSGRMMRTLAAIVNSAPP